MSTEPTQLDPRGLVRQFRETYVNAHKLKRSEPRAYSKARLSNRKDTPINEGDLPQGVRSLLQDYRKAHPKTRVTFLKYQRLENGEPIVVIEDESDLPEEDELLNLSQTVTLTTSSEVRVITEIVVASVETA